MYLFLVLRPIGLELQTLVQDKKLYEKYSITNISYFDADVILQKAGNAINE
jgi:hypothetical protein